MRLKLYSFILLLNSYISGLLVPILSLLLIEKGANLSSISIIMGIYAFTVIIFEVPSGIMADLVGRKKSFCLSLVTSLIFSITILFGKGLFVLCIIFFINGLSRAISTGSFEALFVDSYISEFGKDKLHKVTTRISVLETLGLSAGALTGGFFPEIASIYFPTIGIYDLNIIIKIILTIIVGVLSFLFIIDTTVKESNERIFLKQHIKRSSSMVLKNKIIVCIFISVFSTGFFLSALETYWQPHFISLMPDDSLMILLGVMAFLYLAAAMIGNIISSKIINKFNTKKLYFILRLFLAASLVIMALQINVISFIGFYTIVYLIFGMSNIPEAVILNGEIPNEVRASVLSVNSLILQTGGLAGSLVNSLVINYTTIPNLWIIASVVILVAYIINKSILSKINKLILTYDNHSISI